MIDETQRKYGIGQWDFYEVCGGENAGNKMLGSNDAMQKLVENMRKRNLYKIRENERGCIMSEVCPWC